MKMAKTLPLKLQGYYNSTMLFEEEGQSSYSKKNKYATEIQKIELGFIKQLMTENACKLEGNDGPFTIADFGTADGLGFIQIIPDLVDLIRYHFGSQKQISVILEDLPENDYRSIFQTFQRMTSSEQSPDLAEKLKGVFMTASGTSFYKQCVPNNSLSLVCSSTALHYLSGRPCETESIFPWFSDKSIRDHYAKLGEKDFETFLLHRAKELKTGGLMVLLVIGTDEHGKYTGNTGAGNLCKAMEDVLCDITKRGIITKEESIDCTYATLDRTKEDIMKPFENEASPVRQAGLKLLGIEKVLMQSPYYKELAHSHTHSCNKVVYAAELVDSIKSWSSVILYKGLHKSRPEREKEEILQQYYQQLEHFVGKNALDYVLDYLYYAVMVVKE